MATEVGGNLIEDSVVFGYDTNFGVADNNTATRFYPGEPTTNLQSANQTSGQIAGMSGVSLTYVGQEDGYSKYSMSGTFSNGTYPYCMYLTGVSFTGGTSYSTQVKLKTNVPNKFNNIGGGINYVNQAQNSSGTNSSVLQPDGCYLIKREGFNYVSTTTQSGYIHSNPVNNTTFSSSTDFIYIKDFQIEQNSHSTVYTPTSRSSTESLIDLKNNKSIDISNVSFSSNGQISYDGSNDMITIDVDDIVRNADTITIEGIVKASVGSQAPWGIQTDHTVPADRDGFWFHYNIGGYTYFRVEDSTNGEEGISFSGPVPFVSNVNQHVVTEVGLNHVFVYVNGELKKSYTPDFVWKKIDASKTAYLYIGRTYHNYHISGDIPVFKMHNRGLTASEVKQNYESYKKRFNL
jgi:hypothetical protein